jgi:hypothetical protein
VAGLQELDLAVGGLDDADLVIATGLDPSEVPPSRLASLVVQEVPPRQLDVLLKDWPSQGQVPTDRPSVRTALTPVLAPLWESDGSPLTAARAALQVSGALPDRGLAVADPGPAGYWLARAAPSSHPGAVCVPATVEPGFAAAAALVAALDERPCLAVTDAEGAAHEATAAVVDLARVLDQQVTVQVWGSDGDMVGAGDHVALLETILSGRGPTGAVPVPVDLTLPAALVDAAGPIVAWTS